MRITLKNFKIYKEKTVFNFPENKITLLHGNSGTGKSTILQAIYWCLFGSMQHVYNDNYKDDKTIVTIEMYENKNEEYDLVIKRSKPPKIFKVEYKNQIFEDSSAEDFILRTFSSKDLWTCSSYMMQKKQTPLLTLSNLQKFELLYELTFGETEMTESPDFYIDKIEDELQKISSKLNLKIIDCNSDEDLIKKLTETYKYDLEIWGDYERDEQEMQGICNELISVQEKKHDVNEKYKNLQDKKNEEKNILSTIDSFHSEINKITENKNYKENLENLLSFRELCKKSIKKTELLNKLNKLYYNTEHDNILDIDNYMSKLIYTKNIYISLTEKKIDNIYSNILLQEKYNEYLEKKEEYEKKKNKRQEYEKYLEMVNVVERYENMKEKEKWTENNKKYKKYLMKKEILDNLLILKQEYEQNEKIKKYLSLLQMEEWYKNEENKKIYNIYMGEYEKYVSEKKEYDKYVTLCQELSHITENIEEIEKKIMNLEICKNEIYCPYCNKGVKYNNGKLIKGSEYVYSQTEFDYLKDILIKIKLKNNFVVTKLPEIVEKPEKNWIDMKIKVNLSLKEIKEELKQYVNISIENYQEKNENEYYEIECEIQKIGILEKVEEKEKKWNENIKDINISEKEYMNILLSLENKVYECEKVEDFLQFIEKPKCNIDITRIVQKNECEILKEIESLKNRDTIKNIQKELLEINISENHFFTKGDLENCERNIEEKNMLDRQYEHYKNEIIKKKEKIIHIDENEILSLEKKLEKLSMVETELKQLKESGKNVLFLEKKIILFQTKKEELHKLSTYESSLIELKKIINEVSTTSMNDVLYNINYLTNIYLQELFEDPISIKLDTHKELKKKENKLQVNLKIDYRGVNYDNVEQLSGGENTRISFALTLSLAKTLSSPFLLLDECMSSLDSELKEKCLKILKRDFNDNTIIHICHETVKGMHDNVIYL